MVRIRLRRVGAKKQPSYRVVVADSRSPRDGRFIETIGHYNPRTDPQTVVIYEDRAIYWLSQGAQPSAPVARFFEQLNLADKVKQVHGGAAIADVAAPRPEPAAAQATRKAAPKKSKKAGAEVAAEAAPAVAESAAATVEAAAPVASAEKPEATAPGPAEEAAAPAAAAAVTLSLEALGLTTRVANVLQEAGIETAAQLAALLAEGEDKLLAISGIGAKAVDEIRQQFAEHGLGPDA